MAHFHALAEIILRQGSGGLLKHSSSSLTPRVPLAAAATGAKSVVHVNIERVLVRVSNDSMRVACLVGREGWVKKAIR